MLNLHPEYVVDEKQGRKAVILPLSDWDRLLEELEELDDIRAYDEAKADSQDAVPFAQAVHEIQTDYKA
jgi:PHD/YefM family antitoxin component YafN of YafNO toxin-antitoxin module